MPIGACDGETLARDRDGRSSYSVTVTRHNMTFVKDEKQYYNIFCDVDTR